jgi:hypothetical protein
MHRAWKEQRKLGENRKKLRIGKEEFWIMGAKKDEIFEFLQSGTD